MKRTIVTLLIASMAILVLATGAFQKSFNTKYSVKPDSNLGKAKCGVCHVKATGGKLNPYGQDLAAAAKAAGGKLTPDLLSKVDKLDSDKDGVKNGDEIKKDRNPGVKD